MKRHQVEKAVRTALPSEQGKAVVALSHVITTRTWPTRDWWHERIVHDEGGRWSVTWAVASRAAAFLVSGRSPEPQDAVWRAAAEVERDLRHQYKARPDVIYLDLEASLLAPELVNHEAEGLVVALYRAATPSQRELLDLLDQETPQREIADRLGITDRGVRKRISKLRELV